VSYDIGMQRIESQGLSFLVFEKLYEQAFLKHGISLRRQSSGGDTPTGFNGEFNFSSRDPERARANLEWFCRALELRTDHVTRSQQVHGSGVAVVRQGGQVVNNTDGLITDVRGVVLRLLGADCALIVVYDPKRPALGLAHAGWRGTVQGISVKLVAAMIKEFGCDPSGMMVGIGPAICGECYEVGSEVIHEAENCLSHTEEFIRPVVKRGEASNGDRWLFDLAKANRRQLLEAGLSAGNIEESGCCTFEQSEDFYSYRREGNGAGRWALLAGLI
jgi:polyphenol oxidase